MPNRNLQGLCQMCSKPTMKKKRVIRGQDELTQCDQLAYGVGGVDLPRMSSSTATERTVGLSIEVPRTRWSPEEGNCGKRGIVDGAANGQIIQITQQSIHWNQSAGRESSLGRVGD